MNISNRALSIKEMKDIINKLGWNNKVDISLYSNTNFNDNKMHILIITSDKNNMVGHYCMVYGNTFYDSSGRKPLQLWKDFKLDNDRQNPDNLFNYLKKFKYIDYNNYNYQSNIGSSTCGLHVICRWYYKHMTNDQYKKFLFLIKKKYNYNNFDDLIVDLAKLIIKS